MVIRNYKPEDYEQVKVLYQDSSLYGGQYDDARDSESQMLKLSKTKPDVILVAEEDGEVVGTVTLFEDGRSAWLYRFAVKGGEEVSKALWGRAKTIMKEKGHSQVLVYAPVGNKHFEERYTNVGFSKGNDYTAYWKNI